MHRPLALLTLLLAPSLVLAQAIFQLQEKPGEHLDVLHGGKLIARYMMAYDTATPDRKNETYKPYLHVFDAGGKEPITKGAGGSFPHHRGIYIGWNKLAVGGQTYDRWHMKGGEQVHRKLLAQAADAKGASFTSHVEWTGQGQEPVLVEERTFTFLPAPAPAYALIEMRSKLTAVAGETVLGGDTEHAGLHFRPAEEIVRTETVYVLPKEDADPKKDRDYPWFGETYTLRGKRFSVVFLNHPANPKDASVSAYRDYGRFGAFFKATIPAKGELTIRARFLVAEGEMFTPAVIQQAWNDFAGASEPVPGVRVRKADGAKAPAPAATPAKPAAP